MIIDPCIPPQNIDAEAAVISCCLLDSDAARSVADILRPEDFYKTAHGTIFNTIKDMVAKAEPVDIVTIATRLNERQELAKIGGASFLAQTLESAPVIRNADAYAIAVKDASTRRACIHLANQIQRQATEAESCAALIDAVQSLVTKTVTDSGTKPAAVSCAEVAQTRLHVYEDRYRNAGKITGIPSGIEALDAITCGFQPSDLIVLAARPSMGKTSLAIQFARACQKTSLFFSLEMSTSQVADRIVAQGSGVNLLKFRSGRFSDDDWRGIVDGVESMAGLPMLIDDTPALSVNEMRRRSRIVHLRQTLSLIVVDHLQLARGEKGARSRNEEVGTITKGLKALAKELDCPVLLLSQLNRKFADRQDKRPVLTDLRDSGEIEQDTDIVLFLHRPEVYVVPKRDAAGNETPELLAVKGIANLEIAKHRNGPTGDINMTWHSRSTLFTNREEDRKW